MKNKFLKKIFPIYIILPIILFLNAKIVLSAQNEDKLYEKIDLFSEVLEKIEKEYVDEIDQSEAMDIISINLKNKTSIADFMIVASGNSSRHMQALAEITLEMLKKKGIDNCQIEGRDSGEWKLIDAKDIIIHIFHPEKRKFYNLERMWSELIPKERLTI